MDHAGPGSHPEDANLVPGGLVLSAMGSVRSVIGVEDVFLKVSK